MKDALTALRKEAGLSQYAVAEMLGVQQSTVAMWETGDNQPRAAMLPRIAELYHCTIDDLFKACDEAEEQRDAI